MLLSAGSLDPTFGPNHDGRVTTQLGTQFADSTGLLSSHAVAVDAAGKIVFASGADGLARFNADGSLDDGSATDSTPGDSFGTGGKVLFDIYNPYLHRDYGPVTDMALAPDGKIVVVARAYGDFGIARFDANGNPDLSFGTSGTGQVIGQFGGDGEANRLDGASVVAIQADDKIVVGGTVLGSGVLARYNADGTLDTTFGQAGTIRDIPTTVILSLAIDHQGRIVAQGNTYSGGVLVDRYNANGQPDVSFGIAGSDQIVVPSIEAYTHMAIDASDNLVVACAGRPGGPGVGNEEFAVIRLKGSDGSLDTSFGTGGATLTPFSPSTGPGIYPWSVAVADSGKIVVGGYNINLSGDQTSSFVVARYNSNGSLDDGSVTDSTPADSFGVGGIVTTNFGASVQQQAYAVKIAPDGKIIAAGEAFYLASGQTNYAIARYIAGGAIATPAGANVSVQTVDESTGTSAGVVFSNIVSGGATTLTAISPNSAPPLPANFQLIASGGTPQIFDLHTTATVAGSSTVGFHYAATLNDPGLQLLHYENGQWVDRTSYLDTANHVIYGTVSSFSPFALADRVVQSVQIDIQPESINIAANGVIPVTLYSSATFDATKVDLASVTFAGAHPIGFTTEDVNHDGRKDLLLRFRLQDTNLRSVYSRLLIGDYRVDGVLNSTSQTTQISLLGGTTSGLQFQGSDEATLFLAGKSLRSLLDDLHSQGLL